ncbi:MAG: DNA replication/repair protein RecF [Clostridia bacterium]|nr:DNA replication/repair protein RecF [Clostridia bacterium]
MRVKNLTLRNFRNYREQSISFSPATNIICGNNANGKTNILEAIYIFGYGKSCRAKSDDEMIRFGCGSSWVTMEFESGGREFTAVMNLSGDGRKSFTVNNIPVKRLSRLMSYFHAVLFSPDDLTLVKGSPSARRRFMDAAICRLYPNYFSALSEYQKAASEKNILLKQLKKAGKKSDEYLSVWNEQLAASAERIMEYRRSFVSELAGFAAKIQKDISSEELKTAYEPSLKQDDKESILAFLEENQRREIEAASMRYGIQRDDISIFISDRDARLFASQGQQRTAALAFKIAEADYVFSKTEEYPVLLLDDILSELDIERRKYLWERILDKQVMITCTDTDIFENRRGAKLFTVNSGTVTVSGP